MRILSLLPAATDIVYLLGLEKYLVGDHTIISSKISNALTSLEIDMAVRKLGHRGPGVFHIDQKKLKELKPDLILTQELCDVCAIGFNQVKKAARILDSDTKIISLEPESVGDILENIGVVGEFGGKKKKAEQVIKKLKKRIRNLKFEIRNSTKPKVLVIEWLEPIMIAAHWVPEMVEMAGGEMLITKRGEKSRRINQDQLKLNPDIVVIAPCGFDINRTIKEKHLISNIKSKIPNAKFFLMDGDAYLTRPGPRIIDGIEILCDIINS